MSFNTGNSVQTTSKYFNHNFIFTFVIMSQIFILEALKLIILMKSFCYLFIISYRFYK